MFLPIEEKHNCNVHTLRYLVMEMGPDDEMLCFFFPELWLSSFFPTLVTVLSYHCGGERLEILGCHQLQTSNLQATPILNELVKFQRDHMLLNSFDAFYSVWYTAFLVYKVHKTQQRKDSSDLAVVKMPHMYSVLQKYS
ncbi:hypothetical protein GOODEAATRI_004283 [Goodea atripinnis]|uniref:Uncharacterized protein n=1 Tax=Goodea atripinnis TaxID=208336 RepID=A0ABV0PVM4_9TELE